jgi:ribosomal protein L11 methyltransferase
LLKSFKNNIVSWVKPGGYLALAGILEEEFQSVVDAYTALGFELIEAETLKEWRSGLFRKK